MRYFVEIGDREIEVDVVRGVAEGHLCATVQGNRYDDVAVTSKGISVRVGDRLLEAWPMSSDVNGDQAGSPFRVRVGAEDWSVWVRSGRDNAVQLSKSLATGGRVQAGDVVSPMPGRIVNVLVKEGQRLEAGDVILVIEAMKMENALEASGPSIVKQILVKPGQTVEGGITLVELTPAPNSSPRGRG